jgi:hypothetical protein
LDKSDKRQLPQSWKQLTSRLDSSRLYNKHKSLTVDNMNQHLLGRYASLATGSTIEESGYDFRQEILLFSTALERDLWFPLPLTEQVQAPFPYISSSRG